MLHIFTINSPEGSKVCLTQQRKELGIGQFIPKLGQLPGDIIKLLSCFATQITYRNPVEGYDLV